MSDRREAFFTNVFTSRAWPSEESVSGAGSDSARTVEIVASLPALLHRLGVRSMLDVPCGDFFWMKRVPLEGIDYVGGDIVADLVIQNAASHSKERVRFMHMDLVKDDLPAVDMIFIRDCFIHFSNDLVFDALRNIARSSIKYVCITHDTCDWRYQRANTDIERAVDGVSHEFRPMCFQLPPFNLPAPLDHAADGPTWDGFKVMAVWSREAIGACVAARDALLSQP